MISHRANLHQASAPRLHIALAALALAVVLSVMAVGIVATHRQSKTQILANYKARDAAAASFVSTFISEQAARETQTAQRFLSGRRALSANFTEVVNSFGSDAAVVLNSSGRLLQVAPANRAILGVRIAPRYSHLSGAESGRVSVSGVVPSAATGKPVVAVAVPYSTPNGRRVFSVAYAVAGGVLSAFVQHVSVFKHHLVLLVDAKEEVIASSPITSTASLPALAPALAKVVVHGSHGGVTIAGRPSTFVVASVAGTPWRVIISAPDSQLFASVNGWALWLPWIVFALIAVLAVTVLFFFSRSAIAYRRLETLSAELADAATTDALTGLANRRSLHERLPQTWAYANRHQEPLSALMIDFDDFKQINDSYGHDIGDELLRGVAECMRTAFRGSDIFGRWGGDEFLAVLPGTDEDGARVAGERLRDEVAKLDISEYGLANEVTLSVGCASGADDSVHDLIIRADNALYRAKSEGHGLVVALCDAP